MKTILWLGLLWVLVQGILKKERGVDDWRKENVGDVKYVHYYYDGQTLHGIFVLSAEGTLGLINPINGQLLWRKAFPVPRKIDHAIFLDNRIAYVINTCIDALIVVNNQTTAELWDIRHGALLGSYPLEYNNAKTRYVDMIFVSNAGEQVAVVCADDERVVAGVSRFKRADDTPGAVSSPVIGRKNQTFCLCFYEPLYNLLSVGLQYVTSSEITMTRYDKAKKTLIPTGSFLFAPYDSYFVKTYGHVVGVKLRPSRSITFYSIVDSEALVERLDNPVFRILG
jgi:hypothetical protein